MTLATLLAMSSAADCFSEPARAPSAVQKRIVARGHLTGTRGIQQVVVWRTSTSGTVAGITAHLAIEESTPGHRVLWQADEPFQSSDIDAVQALDLDGDSIPEVLGLWRQAGSRTGVLRVFHWDRNSNKFAELKRTEMGDGAIQSYRIRGRRLVVYKQAAIAGVEFEVKGSEIVPVRGGGGVTTQSESGIEGQAVISPVHPGPTREGQSDTAPFQTTLVISRLSDGTEVARLETGPDGRFRVAVPPGAYKVGPPQNTGRRLPRGGPETVAVTPGKFAHVTINFDSGMR